MDTSRTYNSTSNLLAKSVGLQVEGISGLGVLGVRGFRGLGFLVLGFRGSEV